MKWVLSALHPAVRLGELLKLLDDGAFESGSGDGAGGAGSGAVLDGMGAGVVAIDGLLPAGPGVGHAGIAGGAVHQMNQQRAEAIGLMDALRSTACEMLLHLMPYLGIEDGLVFPGKELAAMADLTGIDGIGSRLQREHMIEGVQEIV